MSRAVAIASALRWLLLASAIAAAAGAFGWSLGARKAPAAAAAFLCPMHPQVTSDSEGECPICGMALVPAGASPAPAPPPAASTAPVGSYACPMHPEQHAAEPGRCAICRMHLVKVEAPAAVAAAPEDFRCPMHEEVHQPGPGKCPLCGMYLERGGAGDTGPGSALGGEIHVTGKRLQAIGARTVKVERGALPGEVRTVGVVAADERRRRVVTLRVGGTIEELFVAETGARVERGQPLARLFSPELHAAQAELLAANRLGGAYLDAAREKLRVLGLGEAEVAEVLASGRARAGVTLRAPQAGFVLHKGVVQGQYVGAGTVLFEVVDLSSVWVLADVYEQDLPQIRAGLTASFAPAHARDDRRLGTVGFVYPTVEATTRTRKLRVELRNAAADLLPGAYGEVRIEVPAASALLVPRDAVIEGGEHDYVLLALGGGRFRPREIHVRGRAGEWVRVEGVSEGEEVATGAAFFLDAESRLRPSLQGYGALQPGASK